MSRPSVTVQFGGRGWTVRPYTLDQCEETEAALDTSAGLSAMGRSRAILAAALRRDHAEHADNVGAMETTPAEVTRAVDAVLRQGGFLEAANATGEAPAAAATDASTGPASGPA